MDHSLSTAGFTSELGKELSFLQNSEQTKSLDPTNTKNIVVTAEDTRIATRLSELAAEIDDQDQLATQSSQNQKSFLQRGGRRVDLKQAFSGFTASISV